MVIIFYCIQQKNKIDILLNLLTTPQKIIPKIVALPCLGKLELIHLLKALEKGAKGVAVCGCADKDCLYPEGSKVARGRLIYGQKILKEIGTEDFRLQYFSEDTDNFATTKERFYSWLKRIFCLT